MLAAPLPQTGVAPRAPSCARWRAARPNPQPHARGAPVVTPASATQVYWSRLALDIVPAATSRWNAESQNSVPACTFSAPYLRARAPPASGAPRLAACPCRLVLVASTFRPRRTSSVRQGHKV